MRARLWGRLSTRFLYPALLRLQPRNRPALEHTASHDSGPTHSGVVIKPDSPRIVALNKTNSGRLAKNEFVAFGCGGGHFSGCDLIDSRAQVVEGKRLGKPVVDLRAERLLCANNVAR